MPECKVGDPPARVIACVNQKGGTGKSATATNLGIGLVQHGKKTLIIDCDSQASQTISLGWPQPDELPVTLATLLSSQMERRQCDPREAILHHAEGVDLLPSSIELFGLELRMVNAMSRETMLKRLVDQLRPGYDFIVLDCPPTLGMITINALAAADSVIVPVQPEYLSVIGMTQLFDTVAQVQQQINPGLQVEGVLITLANMRTNLARNSVDIIRNAYGGNATGGSVSHIRIYSEPIPLSVKIKEASAAGKSIFAHESGGKAAMAYECLVREVLCDARERRTDISTARKAKSER